MVAGAKAGRWYDHERGEGGGFRDLVARELGLDRDGPVEWLDSRIGTLPAARPAGRKGARQQPAPAPAISKAPDDEQAARAARGRNAAAATWSLAKPARPDHPYLLAKQVGPHGLRENSAGELVVSLRDLAGTLHSIEFIAEDGGKRDLFEGAKSGYFCTIGGPIAADRPILVCEGWATLPAPATIGALAAALTGRVPLPAGGDTGWWYGTTERRIRLARGTHTIDRELHADPTAEAIRWSICEGELIQAMGRGRGVNRTEKMPLAIDILTDVVLPVTVSELIPWDELRPAAT